MFHFCYRFRPVAVKEVVHQALVEFLTGKEYDSEATTEWTKILADDIKTRLKGKSVVKKNADWIMLLNDELVHIVIDWYVIYQYFNILVPKNICDIKKMYFVLYFLW